MGRCQDYGPFLDPYYIRCRIIIGIQKGTVILTTTQMVGPTATAFKAESQFSRK